MSLIPTNYLSLQHTILCNVNQPKSQFIKIDFFANKLLIYMDMINGLGVEK